MYASKEAVELNFHPLLGGRPLPATVAAAIVSGSVGRLGREGVAWHGAWALSRTIQQQIGASGRQMRMLQAWAGGWLQEVRALLQENSSLGGIQSCRQLARNLGSGMIDLSSTTCPSTLNAFLELLLIRCFCQPASEIQIQAPEGKMQQHQKNIADVVCMTCRRFQHPNAAQIMDEQAANRARMEGFPGGSRADSIFYKTRMCIKCVLKRGHPV